MILKYFEINKINLSNSNIILFYGKNEGLKDEVSKKIIKNNSILIYEEKEILNDTNNFMEQILSKSLFELEKFLIIKRATDKLVNIIKEIIDKKIDDIKIIINADSLEKKSKLRSLFEKDKRLICVAFYPDTEQTLAKFAYDYFKELKISISLENINLIVNKCNGDRQILLNELNKIEYYAKGKRNISSEQISKITNLLENHSISELIDCCLIKNKKKLLKF